jgi:putative transposase
MTSLLKLIDIKGREGFWDFYSHLIDSAIADGTLLRRDSKWTEAIAVGSRAYVEGVHKKLGIISERIKIVDTENGCILREDRKPYSRGL